MLISNVICETTAFLRLMFLANLFRKLLFIVLPIVLIVVITLKFYKNIIHTSDDFKKDLNLVLKKLGAVIILFFVPLLVDFVISLTGANIRDTYKSCTENATVEKIAYYGQIEEKVSKVKDLILQVRNAPTVENLAIAENAVSDLYGVANGSIIEDLEYSLASIRTNVTMSNVEFNCKAKGGVYVNNICTFPKPTVDGNTSNPSQSGMAYYTFNKTNDYLVVNTKLSVKEYVKIVQSKNICQKQSSGKVYDDQCLCFAEEHAHALTTGDTHKKASQVAYSYYSGFVNKFDDNDKSKILNVIYSELVSNKPIILQVNGNKAGTSRHYVVVIGFKSSVTSASSLKETDLLLIDSYDGKVEQLHEWGRSRFMTTGAKCHKDYSGYQVYMLK